MEKKRNILIVGIGLIGASIALSIKETENDVCIIGFSQNESELIGARNQTIIDEISLNLKAASEKSDVIFLCTPVSVTLTLISELATFSLKESVIITDVGSTKSEIINQSQVLLDKGITFVGGHPMAGSHKSGYLAGSKDLFENAYYIFVPTSFEKTEPINVLKKLLKGTHAKFMILDAKEHDQITSVLSHMPHIIASLLVRQADEMMRDFPNAKHLAAGGFRDITRIASSDPTMWVDISQSNAQQLVNEIDGWLDNLIAFKELLNSKDRDQLYEFFNQAKIVRDSIPIHQEGSIPAFHDLYVNVPDYPGAIAEVTSILAKARISLINIKIMETRDDIFGILCISFKNEIDLTTAKEIITAETLYESMIN